MTPMEKARANFHLALLRSSVPTSCIDEVTELFDAWTEANIILGTVTVAVSDAELAQTHFANELLAHRERYAAQQIGEGLSGAGALEIASEHDAARLERVTTARVWVIKPV